MAQNKRRKKRKVFSPIYLTLVLIILYLPILMVVIYSFNSGRTIGSWQGFTTDWYSRLFSNALMADALKNSLILAVVSALLAGGVGTLGAIGLARSHLKFGGAVETLAIREWKSYLECFSCYCNTFKSHIVSSCKNNCNTCN